jgi:hypothetical protein
VDEATGREERWKKEGRRNEGEKETKKRERRKEADAVCAGCTYALKQLARVAWRRTEA